MHIQQNGQTGREGRIAELTHETQQQNIYQMRRRHADERPLVSNLKSCVTQLYARSVPLKRLSQTSACQIAPVKVSNRGAVDEHTALCDCDRVLHSLSFSLPLLLTGSLALPFFPCTLACSPSLKMRAPLSLFIMITSLPIFVRFSFLSLGDLLCNCGDLSLSLV